MLINFLAVKSNQETERQAAPEATGRFAANKAGSYNNLPEAVKRNTRSEAFGKTGCSTVVKGIRKSSTQEQTKTASVIETDKPVF